MCSFGELDYGGRKGGHNPQRSNWVRGGKFTQKKKKIIRNEESDRMPLELMWKPGGDGSETLYYFADCFDSHGEGRQAGEALNRKE